MSDQSRPTRAAMALALFLVGLSATATFASGLDVAPVIPWPWPAGTDDADGAFPLAPPTRDSPSLPDPLAPPGREKPTSLDKEERPRSFNPWEDRDVRAGRPLVHQEKSAGFWGSVTSKVSLSEPDGGDPLTKRAWKADQGWQLPVLGMVSLFCQVGAASDEAAMREMKLAGRTGLAVKLTMAPGAELQVRGGPGVTCIDPLRPEHVQEKPDLLLEVQCRWPLLGRVGLEYQGTAVPGLTPQDRDRVTQDLGLACPLGQAGKLRLGARRRWDNFLDPRPGSDAKELYLGLQLGGK